MLNQLAGAATAILFAVAGTFVALRVCGLTTAIRMDERGETPGPI